MTGSGGLRGQASPPILGNLLLFARALRRAGLPVSPDQTRGFARALAWVDVGDREQVFHAARSLLVYRQRDLLLFETLFNLFWRGPRKAAPGRGQKAPRAPRHDAERRRRSDLAHLLAERARPSAPEVEVEDRSATYSPQEVLQRKDFGAMTPEELARVRRLIQDLRWRAALRRTRRLVADRRGPHLHLRRVLAEAAKLAGTPLRLWHRSRKIKPRPVVLLADISGSMAKYSRLALLFFYGVSHSLRRVECFVFGTRLTCITGQLALRNPDRALEEAAREVADWSGGTRIGESLRTFNRVWARRVLRRGAVVVIVSDGWERGDAAELGRQMRRLRHRCHRLIWLNPHLGDPRYRPRVEGMSAALPYIDDFLPVHNLQSLQQLAERLGSLPAGRSGAPARRRESAGT